MLFNTPLLYDCPRLLDVKITKKTMITITSLKRLIYTEASSFMNVDDMYYAE